MAILIPADIITQIKNAVDIVDIVSETVLLKKAGRNFVGLCPFHSEKSPSFTVSPEKKIFYCFGCGEGGNAISFLMKQEGLAFPEALRKLAKRYGIELSARDLTPLQRQKASQRQRILQLNQHALQFFQRELWDSDAGGKALAYLQKRGFSAEIIKRFSLGYAPKGWDNLVRFFNKKRLPLALAEVAGLVAAKKGQDGYYDRFRERIIFPILDVNTEVVGFGGRVMDKAEPKYLNSPETPVYQKSRTLYGLNQARNKCRTADTAFIVEGYLDLVALHQNGIENSVATLGTALTAGHIRLLTGYCHRMVLVYDSDEAGVRAAQRCIDIFWKEHIDFQRHDVFQEEKADTHILILPQGHDPDSYLLSYGPTAFLECAARAPGIISFLIERAIAKHGLTTDGKIRIVTELQTPLAAINDSVARALYVKQLSEQIDLDESIVLEKVRDVLMRKSERFSKAKSDPVSGSNASTSAIPRSKTMRLEQQIIAMMLQFPEILSEIEISNVLDYFENKLLKSIGYTILNANVKSPELVSDVIDRIEEPDQKRLVTALALMDESWDKKGCHLLIYQFLETVQRRHRSKSIDDKIKAAELENDSKLLRSLLHEKQKLAMRSVKQKMALLDK